MPKISVIVPVYKVEKYLARCVDSVLAQTFRDFELILVDDGSPDNCPAMCDEYAAKYDFIKVIHKENGGLSDARNVGIEYALTTDSEWITFIDSDDWVHPQYLEILYNACIENNVEISSCGFARVKEFSKDAMLTEINDFKTDVDSAENLLSKKYQPSEFDTVVACTKLYNKELWKEIRFPFGKLYEDMYTTYKVLYESEKIALVEMKLYYYFNNLDSIMHTPLSVERINDKFNAIYCSLDFYYNNNYEKSFHKQLDLLLWSFTSNMNFLRQKDRKTFISLRRRFRKVLKRYRKKLPITEYEDYYLYSYPLFIFRLIKLKYLIRKKLNNLIKKDK